MYIFISFHFTENMVATLWHLSLLTFTLIRASECLYAQAPLAKYRRLDNTPFGLQVRQTLKSIWWQTVTFKWHTFVAYLFTFDFPKRPSCVFWWRRLYGHFQWGNLSIIPICCGEHQYDQNSFDVIKKVHKSTPYRKTCSSIMRVGVFWLNSLLRMCCSIFTLFCPFSVLPIDYIALFTSFGFRWLIQHNLLSGKKARKTAVSCTFPDGMCCKLFQVFYSIWRNHNCIWKIVMRVLVVCKAFNFCITVSI